MVDDARGHKQDHVADDNEGAVLAELGIGLIDDHTNKGVGNAVPDTHDGGNGTGQNDTNTAEAGQEVGDVHERHHIDVGGAVIQGVKCDLPELRAVNTSFRIIQGFLLFCHDDSPLLDVFSSFFSILKSLPRPLRIKGADLQGPIYQFAR